MTLYRIEIDRSTCIGYGGCVREAPDVSWIEDDVAYAQARPATPSAGGGRALPRQRHHCRPLSRAAHSPCRPVTAATRSCWSFSSSSPPPSLERSSLSCSRLLQVVTSVWAS